MIKTIKPVKMPFSYIKNVFIAISILFSTTQSYGQEDNFNCNYKIHNDGYVITPTMSNLLGLLIIPGDQYVYAMKRYKYTLTTDASAYIANTSGTPFYTIKRTGRDIVMVFTVDDGGFADIIKTELANKRISYTFYKDNARIYKCKIPIEGVSRSYSFYVGETNGSCVIGLKEN